MIWLKLNMFTFFYLLVWWIWIIWTGQLSAALRFSSYSWSCILVVKIPFFDSAPTGNIFVLTRNSPSWRSSFPRMHCSLYICSILDYGVCDIQIVPYEFEFIQFIWRSNFLCHWNCKILSLFCSRYRCSIHEWHPPPFGCSPWLVDDDFITHRYFVSLHWNSATWSWS